MNILKCVSSSFAFKLYIFSLIVAFKGKLFEREIFGKSLQESLQFRYALEIRFQEYIFCFVEKFFPSCGEKKKKKKKREDLKMEGRKGRGAEKAVKRKTVEIIWPRFHASGASSVAAIPPQI